MIEIDTDYFYPGNDGYSTYHQLYQALFNLMPRRTQITNLVIEEYPEVIARSGYVRDKYIR